MRNVSTTDLQSSGLGGGIIDADLPESPRLSLNLVMKERDGGEGCEGREH